MLGPGLTTSISLAVPARSCRSRAGTPGARILLPLVDVQDVARHVAALIWMQRPASITARRPALARRFDRASAWQLRAPSTRPIDVHERKRASFTIYLRRHRRGAADPRATRPACSRLGWRPIDGRSPATIDSSCSGTGADPSRRLIRRRGLELLRSASKRQMSISIARRARSKRRMRLLVADRIAGTRPRRPPAWAATMRACNSASGRMQPIGWNEPMKSSVGKPAGIIFR